MAYNLDLPPTVARTATSTYELRNASGDVIATYDTASMAHPEDWWEDLIRYIQNNATSVAAGIYDLTLLMIQSDWEIVDER